MTVEIRRPDNKPNFKNLVRTIAQNIGKAKEGDIQGLLRDANDLMTEGNDHHNVHERAWTWLFATITRAILKAASDQRAFDNTRDDTGPLQTALESLLDNVEGKPLDMALLMNPGGNPALAPVMEKVPGLIRNIIPCGDLTDDDLRKSVIRQMKVEAPLVHAENVAYYQLITDAFDGPMAEAARRNLAWGQHTRWIQSLFNKKVFTTGEEDDAPPLSQVYHRLRCFWHTEEKLDSKSLRRTDHEERQPKRTAHVADLHETLHAWLNAEGKGGNIRVVAGGPGSGKSSFSTAFATEVIDRDTHRVIYIQLQHMPLGGDLYERIGTHLHDLFDPKDPDGNAGFEENPLGWRPYDATPIFLVFDGLDELSHDEDAGKDLSRKFIASVNNMLAKFNSGSTLVRALILGRSTACQDALKEADLDASTLIHVAPLTSLLNDDGKPNHEIFGRIDAFEAPKKLAEADEREKFWERSERSRGEPVKNVPPAVTSPQLHGLNSEPLLLHLLIISGFTDDNSQKAEDNRNVVYNSIISDIYERDKDKDHRAASKLDKRDYFTLQECLGLAAWRGNGRTLSDEDYESIRDLHADRNQQEKFNELNSAELRNVAVQSFTRRDFAGSGGYEFIHKSFGEYLAARGLLEAGRNAAFDLTSRRPPPPEDVAKNWVRLVGHAEVTDEVLRYLQDEVRRFVKDEVFTAETLRSEMKTVAELFHWTAQNGMPAHKVNPDGTFREIETMQRCAESALLAVIDALNRMASERRSKGQPTHPISFAADGDNADPRTAFHFLNRIHATSGHAVRRALRCLDLQGAGLNGTDLRGVDLSGANLSRANLCGANLSGANLGSVNLESTELTDANLKHAVLYHANLTNADLRGASLAGTDLRFANLQQAKLSQTDLTGIELIGATLVSADMSRVKSSDRTDFSRAKLKQANLSEAKLARAIFGRADLSEANLSRAEMTGGADFVYVNLSEADLTKSDLSSAELQASNLSGANFTEANLTKAILRKADLSGANLNFTNLSGADLDQAQIGSTDVDNWNFDHAMLRSLDLSKAQNLRPASVQSAFGVKSGFGLTILPEGFETPDHWHDAEGAEQDTYETRQAFLAAYHKWLATQPPH